MKLIHQTTALLVIKMNNYSKKINKGIGLVEVLIALVLVSTSMILALRTVSNGLRITKENEIRDASNGIMLKAVELKQQPLPDEINEDFERDGVFLQGFLRCYSLNETNPGNGDDISSKLEEVGCDNSGGTLLPEIRSNSDCLRNYSTGVEGQEGICHQVIYTNYKDKSSDENAEIITTRGFFDNKVRITSVVVYTSDGERVKETFEVFKFP